MHILSYQQQTVLPLDVLMICHKKFHFEFETPSREYTLGLLNMLWCGLFNKPIIGLTSFMNKFLHYISSLCARRSIKGLVTKTFTIRLKILC